MIHCLTSSPETSIKANGIARTKVNIGACGNCSHRLSEDSTGSVRTKNSSYPSQDNRLRKTPSENMVYIITSRRGFCIIVVFLLIVGSVYATQSDTYYVHWGHVTPVYRILIPGACRVEISTMPGHTVILLHRKARKKDVKSNPENQD